MSFLVAVYVNEGIVLASDRRSTYTQTENINGLTVQKIGIHVTNKQRQLYSFHTYLWALSEFRCEFIYSFFFFSGLSCCIS